MFYENDIIFMDIMSDEGMLSIIKPKSFDEVPIEATVSNVRVNIIKVKVWRIIGMFGQAVAEVAAYLSYACIIRMDAVSGWGHSPYLVL